MEWWTGNYVRSCYWIFNKCPILANYVSTKDLVLVTDSSYDGLKVGLPQVHNEGSPKVLAYGGRKIFQPVNLLHEMDVLSREETLNSMADNLSCYPLDEATTPVSFSLCAILITFQLSTYSKDPFHKSCSISCMMPPRFWSIRSMCWTQVFFTRWFLEMVVGYFS